MHNIAAHPVQSASTNHKYITPLGHEISNLAVYHSTLSEYQKRTPFTGTLFFLAVDKRDITVPLTYVGGHWKKNNPDGIILIFQKVMKVSFICFLGSVNIAAAELIRIKYYLLIQRGLRNL